MSGVAGSVVAVPEDALSYTVYRMMVGKLLERNTTTGLDVTQERVEYTRLNENRMNRNEKVVELLPDVVMRVSSLPEPETWVVLTEAWCGDSAQSIPVMQKMAAASNGKIRLLLASRDGNPELMDRFTTEGGRSIPKLLRLDAASGEIKGVWGPRPVPGQELMHQWKNSGGAISKDQFHKDLHLWYARDRGVTLQRELLDLLNKSTQS